MPLRCDRMVRHTSTSCEAKVSREARRYPSGTSVASRAARKPKSRGFGSQEGVMTNHEYPSDSLQPRYLTPAGSPPERYPEDDDDSSEANDDEEDFDEDEDIDEDEDEDKEDLDEE